jgi:hypothetical protein
MMLLLLSFVRSPTDYDFVLNSVNWSSRCNQCSLRCCVKHGGMMGDEPNGCQTLPCLSWPLGGYTRDSPTRIFKMCIWPPRTLFLGAFEKLQKATISSVMSDCPSVSNNSAPTRRIFMKFDIWVFFENLPRNLKVSLKSDKNNEYFTWRPKYIFIISRAFLLTMRNASSKSYRENQNTSYVQNFFLSKMVPSMRYVEKCGKGQAGHRW